MRNLIDHLRKIHTKFFMEGWEGYKNSFEVEKAYLNGLPEPQTDIDRGYSQYQCQKKCASKSKFVFLNFVSALVLIPMIIKYRYKKVIYNECNKVNAVFTQDFERDGTLPEQLSLQIKNYVICDYNEGSLSRDDLKYIIRIWKKHPFSFYFLLKNMCRIALYSYAIRQFSPQCVVASCEYSFTSSVLTNYCEKYEIQHINIMHGDKVFFICDAFSRFHIFYIWDEFYKKLFLDLHCDKTKYIVAIPPKFLVKGSQEKEKKVVYYLQLHTEEQLHVIKTMLSLLQRAFLVRPHPLHYNEVITKVFEQTEIEDTNTISLQQSLEKAELVISMYSTVLLQAHWLGIPVAIDDVSNPELYRELKKRSYIMFNKSHILLSDLLRKNKMKI